jgi:hypothetical protein
MIRHNIIFKLTQAIQFVLGIYWLYYAFFGSVDALITGTGYNRIRIGVSHIFMGNIQTGINIIMDSSLPRSLLMGFLFVFPFMMLKKRMLAFYSLLLLLSAIVVIQPVWLFISNPVANFLPILMLIVSYSNILFISIYLIKQRGHTV